LYASFDISSIKADFIQTITNEQNSTIKYSGKFYARRDDKALWIYQKPIIKKLYFLNGKVVIIEPELEQAIFSKAKKLPKILDILKTAQKKGDKLIAKCCDTTYYITVKNNKIISVSYKDKVGNDVKIIFNNEDTNLIIDDAIFRYTIPEDYDILQN
jgi:outer membrane lipoprotein carrier protein